MIVRPASEGDVRGDRAREIFRGDALQTRLDMGAQRVAGRDLMP